MGQALSGGTHISLYWIWPWISFRALLRFLNSQAPGEGLEGSDPRIARGLPP